MPSHTTTVRTQGAFRITVPASVEHIASIALWPFPGGPRQLCALYKNNNELILGLGGEGLKLDLKRWPALTDR